MGQALAPYFVQIVKSGSLTTGMAEAEADRRLADAVVSVLAVVLAGMDADHGERVPELGNEAVQVGDNVLAVDATQRPEVENDDLPAQLRHRQRVRDVEPRLSRRKVRRREVSARASW